MEQFTDIFEQEIINLDTLKEMSHEDLQSVGINTFGQQHKIIKEIRNQKSKNIVNNIVSTETIHFSCLSCENCNGFLSDFNMDRCVKSRITVSLVFSLYSEGIEPS